MRTMRQALWSSIFCAVLTLSASNAARSAEALIDAWQEPPPSSQTARPVWVGNGCWLKWRCGPDGCGWRRFCQSRCPDRYSCFSLYGAYHPYGGTDYWGAYTYSGWGYRP